MNQIALEAVEAKIYLIREHKIMLDKDLAALYGVPTKVLNQAVKRNSSRFPVDFMFQLTEDETNSLRSQIVTSKTHEDQGSLKSQIVISKTSRGGRRFLPYAFTEQGVSMLSSVLNSERAIQVNIAIMRVFSKVKETLIRRHDLAAKLHELEERVDSHDTKIIAIFNAIKQLVDPKKHRPRIGFAPKNHLSLHPRTRMVQ